MVEFNYKTDFELTNENSYGLWIQDLIDHYEFDLGELSYFFVNDTQLLGLNQDYLNHDTLTDIISFDYCVGDLISGDIFISVDRVKENSIELDIKFHVELLRVMAHGLLHFFGFKDKTETEKMVMRKEEDNCIKMFEFHVEH